jgi:zinc protease
MSGVYGVQASAGTAKIPYERASLKIMFPCSPDNVDSLTLAALKEIKAIQSEGVIEEDILSAQEIQRRNMEENLEKNGFWIGSLQKIYRHNASMDLLIRHDELIRQITSEEMKRVANQYFDVEAYLRVVLYPKDLE